MPENAIFWNKKLLKLPQREMGHTTLDAGLGAQQQTLQYSKIVFLSRNLNQICQKTFFFRQTCKNCLSVESSVSKPLLASGG